MGLRGRACESVGKASAGESVVRAVGERRLRREGAVEKWVGAEGTGRNEGRA